MFAASATGKEVRSSIVDRVAAKPSLANLAFTGAPPYHALRACSEGRVRRWLGAVRDGQCDGPCVIAPSRRAIVLAVPSQYKSTQHHRVSIGLDTMRGS